MTRADEIEPGGAGSAGQAASAEVAYAVEPRAKPGFFPMAARRGIFVSFEGIEGSGKSVQLERLAGWLRARGEDPVVTREPGGTPLGRRLRSLLLEPGTEPIDPHTELLLYVADRVQHVLEVIDPALARGDIVLCDRFLDATFAYQGYGRQLPLELLVTLHNHPPLDRRPDRTVLLDLDPKTGLERARRRNRERGMTRKEGRFEMEGLDFHRRVRDGYLALAGSFPDRIRVVPADGPEDEVEGRVLEAVRDLFPHLEEGGPVS
jgi:dTMP kinase